MNLIMKSNSTKYLFEVSIHEQWRQFLVSMTDMKTTNFLATIYQTIKYEHWNKSEAHKLIGIEYPSVKYYIPV